MDSHLEGILRGLIRAERSRRVLTSAYAVADVAERIPVGYGHRPVAIDRELASQYEARGKEWLAITTRVLSQVGFAWTESSVKLVLTFLESELLFDWEELVALAKQRAGQRGGARIDLLEAAQARISGELASELHLLEVAQDRSRIPVVELLQAPRYAAVLGALNKSTQMLNSSTPDYPNAAKEAVASVEQLARIVLDKPTATLGDLIKEFRASGRVAAPLLKGLEEIWGWASSTPSVRHGASSQPNVDGVAARYIFALSVAALPVLLHADAT